MDCCIVDRSLHSCCRRTRKRPKHFGQRRRLQKSDVVCVWIRKERPRRWKGLQRRRVMVGHDLRTEMHDGPPEERALYTFGTKVEAFGLDDTRLIWKWDEASRARMKEMGVISQTLTAFSLPNWANYLLTLRGKLEWKKRRRKQPCSSSTPGVLWKDFIIDSSVRIVFLLLSREFMLWHFSQKRRNRDPFH